MKSLCLSNCQQLYPAVLLGYMIVEHSIIKSNSCLLQFVSRWSLRGGEVECFSPKCRHFIAKFIELTQSALISLFQFRQALSYTFYILLIILFSFPFRHYKILRNVNCTHKDF